MYWDHMNGWGWMMMIVWSLLWVGFLGLIAWAIVQWARRSPQPSSPEQPPAAGTARELLDERLARGDIDLDEYQRRRAAIEEKPRTSV